MELAGQSIHVSSPKRSPYVAVNIPGEDIPGEGDDGWTTPSGDGLLEDAKRKDPFPYFNVDDDHQLQANEVGDFVTNIVEEEIKRDEGTTALAAMVVIGGISRDDVVGAFVKWMKVDDHAKSNEYKLTDVVTLENSGGVQEGEQDGPLGDVRVEEGVQTFAVVRRDDDKNICRFALVFHHCARTKPRDEKTRPARVDHGLEESLCKHALDRAREVGRAVETAREARAEVEVLRREFGLEKGEESNGFVGAANEQLTSQGIFKSARRVFGWYRKLGRGLTKTIYADQAFEKLEKAAKQKPWKDIYKQLEEDREARLLNVDDLEKARQLVSTEFTRLTVFADLGIAGFAVLLTIAGAVAGLLKLLT